MDRERLDARRLLGYLQTHDQVGNRAKGDRISAVVPSGRQAAGAALYLLAPTTPMVFMGEEWAASTPWQFFTSFEEDWLAEAVRDGRRAEFGTHGWTGDEVPDPQDPATRDRSVLRWDEADAEPHARVLRWYRACTALRRVVLGDEPTRLADVEVRADDDDRWVVMEHRPEGRAPYAVVANLSDAEREVPLEGGGALLLAWDLERTSVGENGVRLPKDAVAVVALS